MLDFQTYLGLGRSIGPGSDNAGCEGFWSRAAYLEMEYVNNVLMEDIEAMKHLFGESHS